MKRKYTRWTRELLDPAVRDNISVAGVLKTLNLKPTGGNYANIQKNIVQYGLDISHFKGQGWSKGIFQPLGNLKSKESIRSLVLKEVGNKCEFCGISDWRGSPLTLELDHIDGNRYNNSRENLRILCPNCHSQTPTFRNRKR